MTDNERHTARHGTTLRLPLAVPLLLLVTPALLQSFADACGQNQCNSGGLCFRINQVMLYNVTKCFRIACRSSMITGVSTVVQLEDVGDCRQCCEHNGDIFPVGEEVFFEEDSCTRTCAGEDVWSGCDGEASTTTNSTSEGTTEPVTDSPVRR